VKSIRTKQGKAMALMEVEEEIEGWEVVVFGEVWGGREEDVGKGEVVVVGGKVEEEEEGFKLVGEEVGGV
uniref:hypothetical protein n=1 Tax=Paenibacillus xylanexedens TaxID=528191 RepID=UPI001C92CC75